MADEMGAVETLVHRVLAQHQPFEICPDCPASDTTRIRLARIIAPEIENADEATQLAATQAADRLLPTITEAIDLCWKATAFGQTEDGDVASYILPKGVVHRLVGALQGIGIPASLRAIHNTEES